MSRVHLDDPLVVGDHRARDGLAGVVVVPDGRRGKQRFVRTTAPGHRTARTAARRWPRAVSPRWVIPASAASSSATQARAITSAGKTSGSSARRTIRLSSAYRLGKSTIVYVSELPATADERAHPPDLLRVLLTCFATGDLRQVPKIVSPLYYDHQSAEQPPPHGPELFCRVVQGARKSLPQLDIEIVSVLAIGSDLAESHTRWHWTDEFGQRRLRTTVDRIRVEHGEVVEHWGQEVSA
jgi:predicted SnoaL-like aldol condensation-catalyzing enzyme